MVAVACALLAVQFAGAVHLTFVQHVTCPEHGELIDSREGLTGQESDAGTPRDQAGIWAASALLRELASHEHCVVQAQSRTPLTLGARGDFEAAITPPDAPARFDAAIAPSRLSPLRLAPKQSPPV